MNPGEPFRTGVDRKQVFELEMTPWQDLPAPVRDLPHNVNPGLHLREVYAGMFLRFPLPPPPRDDRTVAEEGPPRTAFDLEAQRNQWGQRFAYFFLAGGMGAGNSGEPMMHFSLASRSPRDDQLRGRFNEATGKLMETLEQIRFQQWLAPGKGLGENLIQQKMAQWCTDAKAAHAALLIAQRENAKNAIPEAEAAMEAAQKKVGQVWSPGPDSLQVSPSIWLPLWLVGLMEAAARPMEDDASYFLALGKQEQAEARRGTHGDISGRGQAPGGRQGKPRCLDGRFGSLGNILEEG